MRVISASRRTDIPAFYSEWFMNRIRAGFCEITLLIRRTVIVMSCGLSMLGLSTTSYSMTSAQSIDPEKSVVVHLHPHENIIGVTDGRVFETYTTGFEFIDQLILLDDLSIDVLMCDFQWSPDGTKLAIFLYGYGFPSTSSILQIWDTTTGQKLYEIPDIEPTAGVTWSPDGTQIAARFNPSRGAKIIRVYDAATGQMLVEIMTPVPISQLAWSPIGDELVFDGFHDIQVWSADTGQSLRILNATVNSDVELAFNPAENLIAFVNLDSDESVIGIWDTDSGQVVRQLQGHTDRIIDFAWSTGGFVSTGADDTIRIWDTQTGQQIRSFQVGRYPRSELSADGTMLLVEDGITGVHIRDAETGDIVAIFGGATSRTATVVFRDPDNIQLEYWLD